MGDRCEGVMIRDIPSLGGIITYNNFTIFDNPGNPGIKPTYVKKIMLKD